MEKEPTPQATDWPTFKIVFAEAYKDWQESQKNVVTACYGTANAVHTKENFEEETIAAIANLATATASNRATTARLTETNAQLTSELKKTAKIS